MALCEIIKEVTPSFSFDDCGKCVIAMSPDGEHFVSINEHGELLLRNVTHSSPVFSYKEFSVGVNRAVAFSHNGEMYGYSNSTGDVTLINAHTQAIIIKFHIDDKIRAFTFGSNDDIVVLSSYKYIYVVDLKGNQLCRLNCTRAHFRQFYSFAISPNGHIIVSGGCGSRLVFWNTSTGNIIRTTSCPTDIQSIAYSPNGRMIAASGYEYCTATSRTKFIRIFDTNTLELIKCIIHNTEFANIAFSHDSTMILSHGADSVIRIWNSNNGLQLAALIGHTSVVTSAAFSSNDRMLISSSEDGTIKIWPIITSGIWTKPAIHDTI